MNISADSIRDAMVASGKSYRRAMGESFTAWKMAVAKAIADGKRLTVVYGAPGCGKSYLIESGKLRGVCIVDVTGLYVAQNSFLMNLPRSKVSFVRVEADRAVCESRIMGRPMRPMDAVCYHGDPKEYIRGMVAKWSLAYASDSSFKWKLPADKVVKN